MGIQSDTAISPHKFWVVALLAASLVVTTGGGVRANVDCSVEPAGGVCTRTAKAVCIGCRNDVRDDYWLEIAKCINISDSEERAECRADAREERGESNDECGEQLEARIDVCDLVGHDRYDPDFDPANFVDPDAIGSTVAPNPFLPLVVGTQWVYEGGDEVVTVTVTDETKLIDGVTCRVVVDIAEEDGEVIEITDDWYAQDLDGNVWYCGEIAQNFETFEGDTPEEPELVDIDGSFKAGREGAKPGILVLANPEVGDVYRQEAALGDAEDVVEVIGVTGSETVPAASCVGDCLVTRDFTPLEPGHEENKHYKAGIGVILEVDVETNERLELVEFTTP